MRSGSVYRASGVLLVTAAADASDDAPTSANAAKSALQPPEA